MRSGFISFTTGLTILGLLLAGSLLLLIPRPVATPTDLLPEVQATLERYQTFLEHLNRDGRYALSGRVEDNRLLLVATSGTEITYRFAGETITREAPGLPPEPLLTGVGSARFSQGQLIPRLLSIFIVPANNQLPPFMTSIAPRGTRP